MKLPVVCNYCIVRFLPYPESGEFVNVGVVVHSPETGFFDFRLERRKFRRIANFFPELKRDFYRDGMSACFDEMNRIRTEIGVSGEHAGQMVFEPALSAVLFRELVRPRESIIRYSEPGTILSPEPEVVLNELFAYYVERMFAQESDYQEEVMRKRVLNMLQTHRILGRFKQAYRVGNEEYNFRLPFVRESRIGVIEKAIKPLNLAQADSTRIYDHGELWVNRIKRLKKMDAAPREMLFTVNEPPSGTRKHGAFMEVCGELKHQGAKVLRATEELAIVEFAASDAP